MTMFRDVLINDRPFKKFVIYCSECDETLVELGDLTKMPCKNEAFVLYQVREHARDSGHTSFDGDIEPIGQLRHIDSSITVESTK